VKSIDSNKLKNLIDQWKNLKANWQNHPNSTFAKACEYSSIVTVLAKKALAENMSIRDVYWGFENQYRKETDLNRIYQEIVSAKKDLAHVVILDKIKALVKEYKGSDRLAVHIVVSPQILVLLEILGKMKIEPKDRKNVVLALKNLSIDSALDEAIKSRCKRVLGRLDDQ